MEKDPKSKSYIIKEAESVIDSYLKNKKKEFSDLNYKEKYERLKIISIAMGIVYFSGILLTLIFK